MGRMAHRVEDATLPQESALPVAAAVPADRAILADGPAPGPGDRIARYQLRRLLGQGGMSQVYLARDTTLGRSVALKLIRPERVSPQEAALFIGEAQLTSRLNHPNIVQLYDAGLHVGGAFIALEYLDGASLHDRMQRSQMTVDEILRIASAIADALGHAHAAQITHW